MERVESDKVNDVNAVNDVVANEEPIERQQNNGLYARICCETKAWLALVFLCSATFLQDST